MSQQQYRELVKNNTRITLDGFKRPMPGYSRGILQHCNDILRGVRRVLPIFRVAGGDTPSWFRALDLKVMMENSLSSREVHLGVLVLALIHLGYQIRQVRGQRDGTIIRRRP
jgi:hypothetical protein